VTLSNAHRTIATDLGVKGIRGEMRTRTGHRQEVMDKSQRCLDTEIKENEALRVSTQQRRRKIERARRKLDRIRADNLVVQK
jgi:esterase/lipase